MRCAHLNIETNALFICGGRKAISSAERDASVSLTDDMGAAKSTSQKSRTFLCPLADSWGMSS